MTSTTNFRASITVSTGSEIGLRPLRTRDAARFAEALNDPDIRYWMHGVPDPYTKADAFRTLSQPPRVHADTADPYWAWAVVDTEDQLQGKVSLSDYDGRSVNLAYWAHPEARGRGWMTSAVEAVVGAAFAAEFGLTAIHARVAVGNRSSRALLDRVGFMPTETCSDYRMGDGTYAEGVRYVRTRES